MNVLIITFYITALLIRLAQARPGQIDFDTYGHLYFAAEIRDQGASPWSGIRTRVKTPSELFEIRLYQPFLWNWLVSMLLKSSNLLKYQHCINPIIESSALAVFAVIALELGFAPATVILASALYLFSPSLFSDYTSGPRLRSATPRLSSEVMVTLYFLCVQAYIETSSLFYFAIGLVSAFYVLNSSKFGQQALILIAAISTLFLKNITVIAPLGIAMTVTVLLAGTSILDSLRARQAHYYWYAKQTWFSRSHIEHRLDFRKHFIHIYTRNWFELYRSAHLNPIIFVLLFSPVIIAFTTAIIPPPGNLAYSNLNDSLDNLSVFAIIGLGVFLLTSTRPLLFLGESERYINHIFFVLTLVTCEIYLASGQYLVLLIVLAYGILFWVIELLVKRNWSITRTGIDMLSKASGKNVVNMETEATSIISFLHKIRQPQTVLCQPYHAVGVWRILFSTRHYVVFPFTKGEDFQKYFNATFGADYPYINVEKLRTLVGDLGVGVIILRRSRLTAELLAEIEAFSDFRKVLPGLKCFFIFIRNEP